MRRFWLSLISALCLALALAGVAGARTPAASKTVTIQNFAFSPASVTVNVGDSVTWSNSDTAPHTATRSDAPSFDTGTIEAGQSGSVTFSTAGTYTYVCKFHPNMTGTVVVQAAAQPTSASPAATPAATTPGMPSTGEGDAAGVWQLLALATLLGLGGLLLLGRRAA